MYTSAACGADLLFIEATLAAGAEVNVVLPFDRGDFLRTSVATGGPEWVQRFDAALARATRVIFATEEGYLGDDILFRQAAYLVEGLTTLRAAQLETTPSLLAVFDADAAGGVGGTRDAVERWRRDVGSVRRWISRRCASARPSPGAQGAGLTLDSRRPPSVDAGPRAGERSGAARVLKAMVFADFAGLQPPLRCNVARFQQAFWSIAAREIAAADARRTSPTPGATASTSCSMCRATPRRSRSACVSAMHATDWQAVRPSRRQPDPHRV